MGTALIILAAGEGKRMKSDLPKVLHRIADAPMLVHAMNAGATLDPDKVIIVTGHGHDEVRRAALAHNPDVEVVHQAERLGTAHAVQQAAPALKDHCGDALVLYGDTPFIQAETLQRMRNARTTADIVVLGFEAAEPGRYGRLVTQGDALLKIIEFKDATDAERAIRLCNSGVIMAPAALLLDLISKVGNDNASGEYYLTDIIALARAEGRSAVAVTCDESETMGINSRNQLAEAEAAFQTRRRAAAMDNGVTLTAPDTVQFSYDTHIGRDAQVEPYVVFGPGVTVETGARIRAFSHLEGCHVSRGAVVGPYARLRPGTELSEDVRIGNFVEIKNAVIGEAAKVNHLSYIGDAQIGEASNIGAGTVTCNYDGVGKHQTVIGARVFIGSDTMLVAPVTIGDEAMTATGSVITQDVAAGSLAIARSKQIEKPGGARRLFELLKAKAKNRG